jgi:uncharacterized membrane protein (DUF4010 family)
MLVALAALTCLTALGYVDDATPRVSSAITLTSLVLLLPFALGAAVGRRWIVAFVFTAVVGTALLPDRTVVHNSAHAFVSTTYDTSFAPMLMLGLVAATAAYAGLATRRR